MSSPVSCDVGIRRAQADDAAVSGQICYDAFVTINRQHNFPPELPNPETAIGLVGNLFSHPGYFCVVAETNGKVIGSSCMDERSTIAGIGPVTVDPSTQNRGVGRALMLALMGRARERGFPGVRLLQATFHTRSLSLYAKLGFDPRELMLVMHGAPIGKSFEGCVVRSAVKFDMEAANLLCESIHGHTRSGDLADAVEAGRATVVERDGKITGYSSGFGYFGHAVAESTADLQAMIASLLEIPRPGIIVPATSAELLRWCLTSGLRVVHPMTLMTAGLYNQPRGAYLPSVLY